MRRLVMLGLPAAISLMLALAACSGADTKRLEATVEAQATRIATLEAKGQPLAGVPLPAATPASSAAAASYPFFTVPSPTPTPLAQGHSSEVQVLYIANTGGEGVRVRVMCRDDSPGSGVWPEGAAVTLGNADAGCSGWLKVWRSGAEWSWVRAQYLSETPPLRSDPVTRPRGVAPTGLRIEVLSFTHSVKRGEVVSLVVRTQPGATVSTTIAMPWTEGRATLGGETTGGDGIAEFAFVVPTGYLPGHEPGGLVEQSSRMSPAPFDPEAYRQFPSGAYDIHVVSDLGRQRAYERVTFVVE
ncbi:MAG: hypothetical protein ABIH46_11690 [Chloroflexota bacterium]